MTTAVKKLIENIDQLVCWLNENPKTPVPTQEKNRISAILDKIKSATELTHEEWEKMKPVSDKFFKKFPSTVGSKTEYVVCDLCGDKLNKKNITKHKTKCRERHKTQSKKLTNPPKQKKTPRGAIYTDKTYFNEAKINRNLDGSKDYWQIRDQGRFGSHSSYDNMDDESSPDG